MCKIWTEVDILHLMKSKIKFHHIWIMNALNFIMMAPNCNHQGIVFSLDTVKATVTD